MPCIPTTGDPDVDARLVRAYMLWPAPDDEPTRQQYYVASYTRSLTSVTAKGTVTLPLEAVVSLLHARAWGEQLDDARGRTRRGSLAGYVFALMYLMDLTKEELPRRGAPGASLQKAYAVTAAWSRGRTWRDGEPMRASVKSVRTAWDEYKCVAHLWGALELRKLFDPSPTASALAPEGIKDFLRTATGLQHFANQFSLDNKSRQARTPLVDPSALWAISPAHYEPRSLLTRSLGEMSIQDLFDDAPFMELLKKYKG